MKAANIYKLVFLISITLISPIGHTKLLKTWSTDSKFSAPESVIYDKKRNLLYVSNYNDQGGFKRRDKGIKNEFISKLDMHGNIQQRRWIKNIEAPTGMTIFNDKLYIAVRSGFLVANIDTGIIEQQITIADAKFLNDIVVSSNGVVYMSDSGKSQIYRIKNNNVEVWLKNKFINSPNGLHISGNQLLVGNKGNLISVDLTDKTVKLIGTNISAKIDGIKPYKSGYLISWKSKLQYFINGEKQILYRAKSKKDFIADFEFIEEDKLIIIPQFISGQITALKITE